MDVLMVAFSISIGLIAFMLYFELRKTQDKMDDIRGELEKRFSQSLEVVLSRTAQQLPEIERRVHIMEEELAQTKSELHHLSHPEKDEDKEEADKAAK
jgi:Tfp pilus assembly protein PilO